MIDRKVMSARLMVLQAFDDAVAQDVEMTIVAYTEDGRIIPWKDYPSMTPRA